MVLPAEATPHSARSMSGATVRVTVEEVAFDTHEFPAHWVMEDGKVVPAPGTPEEEEWKKLDE